MTPKDAWKKYKHLDKYLSDKDLLIATFSGSVLFDLWSAVKEALKNEKRR